MISDRSGRRLAHGPPDTPWVSLPAGSDCYAWACTLPTIVGRFSASASPVSTKLTCPRSELERAVATATA